jgi:hypothetical protein
MVLPIQFDGGRTVDVTDGSTVIEASLRNAVLLGGVGPRLEPTSASGGAVGAAIAGLAFARDWRPQGRFVEIAGNRITAFRPSFGV